MLAPPRRTRSGRFESLQSGRREDVCATRRYSAYITSTYESDLDLRLAAFRSPTGCLRLRRTRGNRAHCVGAVDHRAVRTEGDAARQYWRRMAPCRDASGASDGSWRAGAQAGMSRSNWRYATLRAFHGHDRWRARRTQPGVRCERPSVHQIAACMPAGSASLLLHGDAARGRWLPDFRQTGLRAGHANAGSPLHSSRSAAHRPSRPWFTTDRPKADDIPVMPVTAASG